MSRSPILVAAACIALAFAGCGSDSKKSDDSSAPPATPPPAAATPSNNGTVEVAMKASKFVPADISVKVGQPIKWTNDDGYAHNVTSVDPSSEEISSGNLDGGATFEYTPKKAGKINYVCTIHSDQTGVITVTK
jgi:plastocyanin